MKTNKILMAVMAVFAISILSLGVMAYRGNPDEKSPYYNEEVHQQLEDAMEAGDYDLWMSIREENNLPTKGKIFSVITEENFDKFVALHEANEAGDVDTANAIKEELGLSQGMMKRGNSKGTGQGMNQQKMHGMQGRNNGGNFVDADNDGNCDNLGLNLGKGRR